MTSSEANAIAALPAPLADALRRISDRTLAHPKAEDEHSITEALHDVVLYGDDVDRSDICALFKDYPKELTEFFGLQDGKRVGDMAFHMIEIMCAQGDLELMDLGAIFDGRHVVMDLRAEQFWSTDDDVSYRVNDPLVNALVATLAKYPTVFTAFVNGWPIYSELAMMAERLSLRLHFGLPQAAP